MEAACWLVLETKGSRESQDGTELDLAKRDTQEMAAGNGREISPHVAPCDRNKVSQMGDGSLAKELLGGGAALTQRWAVFTEMEPGNGGRPGHRPNGPGGIHPLDGGRFQRLTWSSTLNSHPSNFEGRPGLHKILI